MRARLSGGNQLIVPIKAPLVMDGSVFVDIEVKEGRLVLIPLKEFSWDDMYEHSERQGIAGSDIANEVKWVRRGGGWMNRFSLQNTSCHSHYE